MRGSNRFFRLDPSTSEDDERGIAVKFENLTRWDIKTAIASAFRAEHPNFVAFGEFIEECTKTVRPFDEPDKMWPVYGVNNRTGVFFSHFQKGEEFNSPYKVIQRNWFFHNPTRANVGSIGLVKEVEEDAITSPEYQVWRIKDVSWIPEYVEILMKMPFFNKLVQVHRVGAVKERLYTRNLMEIPVPAHSREFQKQIIKNWNEVKLGIEEIKNQIAEEERNAVSYLRKALGIFTTNNIKKPKSFAVNWSNIDDWGFNTTWNLLNRSPAAKFPTVRTKKICKIGSGGTPSRKVLEYYEDGTIPWVKTTEVRDNLLTETEEEITSLGLNNSSAKLYPIGSLIIAMYGATRGRTAKLGIEAATNQACCVLYNISPEIDVDFLWFYFMLESESLKKLAVGSAQPNLNAEMIANFEVPIPPLNEQRKIVDKVKSIRDSVARKRTLINELSQKAIAEIERTIIQ